MQYGDYTNMRLHLIANNVTDVHTWFSVFINGGCAGQLCMRNDEAIWFRNLLLRGNSFLSEIKYSGDWHKPETEKSTG